MWKLKPLPPRGINWVLMHLSPKAHINTAQDIYASHKAYWVIMNIIFKDMTNIMIWSQNAGRLNYIYQEMTNEIEISFVSYKTNWTDMKHETPKLKSFTYDKRVRCRLYCYFRGSISKQLFSNYCLFWICISFENLNFYA